ncbi:MAG: AAA family ATPase [Candidatus Babeliales bacterium]
MKKLPIGIQSFERLIRDNYIYVDKTALLHQLITQGKSYFISRPRRFGKSLLVSTLKEIFLGNKPLFENMAIAQLPYDWQQHPVIYLDMSALDVDSVTSFKKDLVRELCAIADTYTIGLEDITSPSAIMRSLIRKLSSINSVAVLVDEYDAPILKHVTNLRVAEAMREQLRSLYGIFKSMDAHIKFTFLTGITKFSRTSIFSGLNNLNDISTYDEYSGLLGYTQEELEQYFGDYLDAQATIEAIPKKRLLQETKLWYNGYHFSEKSPGMYNPFSILCYLSKKKRENFWFETGTPTFLMQLLRREHAGIEKLLEGSVTVSTLSSFNIETLPIIPLMFQTGYLTIKEYDAAEKTYRLGIPNEEVRISLDRYLLASFAERDVSEVEAYVHDIRRALEKTDIPLFFEQLRSLFAHIPYQLHIPQERYYHSLFQMLGTVLGYNIQSEVSTDKGRIDVVFIMKQHVYVFEFKFNSSAAQALEQIEERRYFERYLTAKKAIMLLGVSFNRTKKSFTIEYAAKAVEHEQ